MANNSLTDAKKAKNDEFYTLLSDIENEVKHYREHFKGKVVYLNCDDPEESNFWLFFKLNFKFLGLKKLISMHYERSIPSYMLVIDKDTTGDGIVDERDAIKVPLKQNGDFRSSESIELLKEADIVVTNPPFSLFREYIAQLMEYDKKFLIVGDQNAITYKQIFPLVKNNQLWLGVTKPKWYRIPDDREDFDVNKSKFKEEDGIKYQGFGNHSWYTNLEHAKRNDTLDTGMKYYGNEEKYPKYDSYDVINVDKVKNIPMDFQSFMGVPITFLEKINPKQFEILGIANNVRWIGYECITIISGRKVYNRLIIKKK